jgi:hypothetical protein
METVSRSSLTEFKAVVGRTVDAVFQDDGYWHLIVALRCTDGESIVFNTEDVYIAKYFEVFPIKVKVEPTEQRAWRRLNEIRTIQEAIPLFREEWLEPSAPHPELVGSAPHYVQHAGRGPVPSDAVQHVTVQAGVKLCFGLGESMLVYASNTAPFNVAVAVTNIEVENALAAFNATDA